jgi:hypothetical protein
MLTFFKCVTVAGGKPAASAQFLLDPDSSARGQSHLSIRETGETWVRNMAAGSIVRVIKARRMRWAGHVPRMREVRGAYNISVGTSEGRRPLGRPRRKWRDNIKMDLREIGFGDVDWIHWAQDRDRWRALVNTVMNLRVPLNAGNFLTS